MRPLLMKQRRDHSDWFHYLCLERETERGRDKQSEREMILFYSIFLCRSRKTRTETNPSSKALSRPVRT